VIGAHLPARVALQGTGRDAQTLRLPLLIEAADTARSTVLVTTWVYDGHTVALNVCGGGGCFPPLLEGLGGRLLVHQHPWLLTGGRGLVVVQPELLVLPQFVLSISAVYEEHSN